MDIKDKPKIQAAGIVLILVGVLYSPYTYDAITKSGAIDQIVTTSAILIFFTGMGIGCIIKPDIFGPIASALGEIGRNFAASGNNDVDQSQENPSQSPQVNAGRDVSIQYTGQNEDVFRKEGLQKEMDLLISPLYAKSHGDFKKIYFMKGSPGNIDSGRKRDKDYFAFWENVSHNIYLAPDYLRDAYERYIKNKSKTIGDASRDRAYEKGEKDFFDKIERRYEELRHQLKN